MPSAGTSDRRPAGDRPPNAEYAYRASHAVGAGTGPWAALSAVQEPVIRVNRYLWRSQALKFWPLLERIEALITVAPAAVSVVVSVYWLVAQGPRMVPCSPL